MYSGRSTRALPRVGFPIRKSRDQRLVSTSPRLIAAAHVLHRLLAPRHPPCALVLLIMKNTVILPLWSFQGALGPLRFPEEWLPEGMARSLKTQQRALPVRGRVSGSAADNIEVDVISRRARIRTAPRIAFRQSEQNSHHGRVAHRGKSPGIPRKEVIQPQLPLRLPCYDFTPVTNPTFGGCLPKGLAHRLRVLPASVV